MAFPNYGAEVVFNFTLPPGTTAKTVLHVEKTPHSAIVQADLDALAAAGVDWWENDHSPVDNAKSGYNHGVTLVSVTATARGLTPQLQAVEVSGQPGELSGNALPPESSVVTTWYTGTPGRSYRGRNFWPHLHYGALGANGELTSGEVTSTAAAYAKLRELLEASFSGALLSVYSATLGVMTPVNASSPVVRAIIHHQRRRNT